MVRLPPYWNRRQRRTGQSAHGRLRSSACSPPLGIGDLAGDCGLGHYGRLTLRGRRCSADSLTGSGTGPARWPARTPGRVGGDRLRLSSSASGGHLWTSLMSASMRSGTAQIAAARSSPLARRRQDTVAFVHHQRAGRQLPGRVGPRGAPRPGVRPSHRRTGAVGGPAAGDHHLIPARGRVRGHEMASPGSAFARQHGRGAGHRHPRAHRAHRQQATGPLAARRAVRARPQPPAAKRCCRSGRRQCARLAGTSLAAHPAPARSPSSGWRWVPWQCGSMAAQPRRTPSPANGRCSIAPWPTPPNWASSPATRSTKCSGWRPPPTPC
jgi:hypothetical protein